MNDDYLWDKTGEPDPEVQHLEQVLGKLRYQPRALDIPAQGLSALKARWFRSFVRPLAIAATITVMLVGLGLWLALHRSQPKELGNIEPEHPAVKGTAGTVDGHPIKAPNANHTENTENFAVAPSVEASNRRPSRANRHELSQKIFARYTGRTRRPTLNAAKLPPNELREAEAAKVQLMLALRVASSKLNFAQRKTQGSTSENMFHNQHKIG